MAITDLTGTTWVINAYPTISYDLIGYDVNFTTNNTSYWAFIQDEGNIRYIGNTTAYAYGDGIGWTNEAYRTVVFTGGDDITNISLITWLQANAIIQTNDYFTCTDELKSIADAIRTKGGTSASLIYPDGFVTAINNLSTKVLGTLSINQGTPFDIQVTADDYSGGDWDGFSSVSININTPFYDGSCDIIDPPQPFNFTIDNTTYTAIEGMTWGEWVESEYNTDNYYSAPFGNNYTIIMDSNGMLAVCHRMSYPVYANEVIGTGVGGQGEQTAYVLALY